MTTAEEDLAETTPGVVQQGWKGLPQDGVDAHLMTMTGSTSLKWQSAIETITKRPPHLFGKKRRDRAGEISQGHLVLLLQ